MDISIRRKGIDDPLIQGIHQQASIFTELSEFLGKVDYQKKAQDTSSIGSEGSEYFLKYGPTGLGPQPQSYECSQQAIEVILNKKKEKLSDLFNSLPILMSLPEYIRLDNLQASKEIIFKNIFYLAEDSSLEFKDVASALTIITSGNVCNSMGLMVPRPKEEDYFRMLWTILSNFEFLNLFLSKIIEYARKDQISEFFNNLRNFLSGKSPSDSIQKLLKDFFEGNYVDSVNDLQIKAAKQAQVLEGESDLLLIKSEIDALIGTVKQQEIKEFAEKMKNVKFYYARGIKTKMEYFKALKVLLEYLSEDADGKKWLLGSKENFIKFLTDVAPLAGSERFNLLILDSFFDIQQEGMVSKNTHFHNSIFSSNYTYSIKIPDLDNQPDFGYFSYISKFLLEHEKVHKFIEKCAGLDTINEIYAFCMFLSKLTIPIDRAIEFFDEAYNYFGTSWEAFDKILKSLYQTPTFFAKVSGLSKEEIHSRVEAISVYYLMYRSNSFGISPPNQEVLDNLLEKFFELDPQLINKVYNDPLIKKIVDSYYLFGGGNEYFYHDYNFCPGLYFSDLNQLFDKLSQLQKILEDANARGNIERYLNKYVETFGSYFRTDLDIDTLILIGNFPNSRYVDELLDCILLDTNFSFSEDGKSFSIVSVSYKTYRRAHITSDVIANFLFYKENEDKFWEVMNFLVTNFENKMKLNLYYPSRLSKIRMFIVRPGAIPLDNRIEFFKSLFEEEKRKRFLVLISPSSRLSDIWLNVTYGFSDLAEFNMLVEFLDNSDVSPNVMADLLDKVIELNGGILDKEVLATLLRSLGNIHGADLYEKLRKRLELFEKPLVGFSIKRITSLLKNLISDLNLYNLEGETIEDSRHWIVRFIQINFPEFAGEIKDSMDEDNLILFLSNVRFFENFQQSNDQLGERAEIYKRFPAIFFFSGDEFKYKLETIRFAIGLISDTSLLMNETPQYRILYGIIRNPSKEIQKVSLSIIQEIFRSSDPQVTYERILKVFTNPNLPFIGKILAVFRYLYRDLKKGYESLGGRSAIIERVRGLSGKEPLRVASVLEGTIYKDVVNSAIRSGDIELFEYISSLSNLFATLPVNHETPLAKYYNRTADKFTVLNDIKKIIALLTVVLPGEDYAEINRILSKLNNPESLASEISQIDIQLNNLVGGGSWVEWLIYYFLKPLGFNQPEQVLQEFRRVREISTERNKGLYQRTGGNFTFSSFTEGNTRVFAKGIRMQYLDSVRDSFRCPELLGGDSKSDATPMDTDVALLSDEGSFKDTIQKSIAYGYGEVIAIFREDDEFKHQYEVVDNGGVAGHNHYGIRSAIGWYDLSSLIFKDLRDEKALLRLKYEIVKKAVYIPILNIDGKCIFTYEEYEEKRKLTRGIAHYYGEPMVSQLEESEKYPRLEQKLRAVQSELQATDTHVNEQIELATDMIEKVIAEVGIHLDNQSSESSLDAHLHQSGSSGRQTQVPGSSDIDMHLEVSSQDWDKLEELVKNLTKTFRLDSTKFMFNKSEGYCQMRLFECKLSDGSQISIDIGAFIRTNDRGGFVHEAIDAQMNAVVATYPESERDKKRNLLRANIVLAKKILQEEKVYKRFVENQQMGLGGSGVETWILSHGGSVLEAFRTFYDAAKTNTSIPRHFSEFKERYQILSLGSNIRTNHFEDYILNNLSEVGYQRMFDAIEKSLREWHVIS